MPDQSRSQPSALSRRACRPLAAGSRRAGDKARRGQKGSAHAYNIKGHREQERRFVEQAEAAYAHFVAGWMPRGAKPAPKARTGAASEERR
jgi:transposase